MSLIKYQVRYFLFVSCAFLMSYLNSFLIILLKKLVHMRYFSRHQEFTEWFLVLETLVILVQFCLKNKFVFILKKMQNDCYRIFF